MNRSDIRERLGLRPIINVSGTMTSLGASIVVDDAVRAMAEILPEFVEVDDLQRKASRIIARLCGTEAGYVTASAAAGLTLCVAGCMTRDRLLAVERLPDTAGLKDQVLIQMGHMVGYGAAVEQGIRLSGAKVVPVGNVALAQAYQLEQAINEQTAAAMYVVSHHTVQYGLIPLEEFAAICRAAGVPVIVDAASEYDLQGFIAKGADLAIYSGHKFLGGPTSGIVAGAKDLVRAAYLQNRGIGRGMKVGKESVAGVMAALEAWERRDHEGIRRREMEALELWREALEPLPGLRPVIVPDPTHNPLDRLQVWVDPASGFTAAGLAAALGSGDRPVIVRDHESELGYFFLDPCNLHPGEAEIVAERVVATVRGSNSGRFVEDRRGGTERLLAWPD